jgi:hypothetical protein
LSCLFSVFSLPIFPSVLSSKRSLCPLLCFCFSSLLSTESEADIPSCCSVSVHPNWAAVRGGRARFFPNELLILGSEVSSAAVLPTGPCQGNFFSAGFILPPVSFLVSIQASRDAGTRLPDFLPKFCCPHPASSFSRTGSEFQA